MKKFYFLTALVLAFMTSCHNEELFENAVQAESHVKVTATLSDNPATRTQLSSIDGGYKVLWSEDDAISVLNNGKHYKYSLDKGGAGQTTADFSYDPTFGSISAGIETGISKDVFVAVYPFSENVTLSKNNEDYVINTVIPTNQTYAEGSFGVNVAPMVAVAKYAPDFSFKNVASVLVMPLKGKENIVSAVLESKAHKIAGAATVKAVAKNEWIPTVNVEKGENKVVLSCGEGVQLNEEETTKFYFVLAPGTYEANDLSVKFTDSYGNYFVTEITAENTFTRSKSRTFKERTFNAQGTEEVELWVKAKAGASMSAERIIPSVKDVDVEGWVKNLKDQANTKALIEEAITYITLKNYKAAYEVLGGIPGFVKDVKRFEANGSFIQKVDYTGVSYLVSMLEGIESINNIQSLLDYLNEFEKVYEASGLKNELDKKLGSIANNFDTYIDDYVDKMWESVYKEPELEETPEKPELTEEEAFAAYKTKIKEQIETSIFSANVQLGIIKAVQMVKPSAMKEEKQQLEAYIDAVTRFKESLDGYTSIDTIKDNIKNLPKVNVHVSIDLGKWPGGVKTVEFTEDPENFLTGADKDYSEWENAMSEWEQAVKDQIAGNEQAVEKAKDLAKALVRTEIEKIQEASLVESLETAVNEPGSTTGKVLNYLFAQESFMESVKTSLREIVTNIEEESKDKVDAGNVDKKQQAINTAIQNALINARVDAVDKILLEFNATNEANLNNGPWATFKKILNWQKCVEVFTELKILDMYDALVELSEVVDEMITYDRGSILYDIEEFADYQENVDWWILKFNEELE